MTMAHVERWGRRGAWAYLWRELRTEHDLADFDAAGRRAALVLALVWVVVAWWSYVLERRGPNPPHVLASAAADLVLLGAWTLAFVRRDRAGRHEKEAIAFLVGAAGVTLVALEGWVSPGLFIGVVGAMGMASRIGPLGPVLALLVAAGYLAVVSVQGGFNLFVVLFGTGSLLAAYLFPVVGRRDRQLLRERAATEERERLAREVHDVLAHTLTALAVQLEGARMVLEDRSADPRALAAVDRAQRLAAAGLEETHQAVAALRGDAPPGPESLPRLAREFERETGVPTRFEVEGEPVPLRADAALAVYRAAQEALTNVRKHADATEVTVRLRYAGGGAELVVCDRGRPKPSVAPGGYGLAGIHERAELLGGRFESGARPDGFEVRLWVPA